MYVLVAHNFVLVAHKLHFGQEIPSPNSGFIVILQKNRNLNLANSIENTIFAYKKCLFCITLTNRKCFFRLSLFR